MSSISKLGISKSEIFKSEFFRSEIFRSEISKFEIFKSEIYSRWIAPLSVASVLVALSTGLLLAIYLQWHADHLIFGYFVPIALVAIRYGSVPALATVAASDFCAAYFLYPPDYSIYISNPLQVAELTFFSLLVLATCQFIGGLADDERLRKRTVASK